MIRLSQNGNGLGVSLRFFEFDFNNVLAAFELKDGHAAGNIADENVIDVNASCAGIESFRR